MNDEKKPRTYTEKGVVTDRKYLKQRCRDAVPDEIEEVKNKLKSAFAKQEDCAGLAAIQIGIPVRMSIMEKGGFLINPVIEERSGLRTSNEGCMSFPGRRLRIERADRVVVTDDHGGKRTFKGFDAAVVQHEIDNMNGITVIDRFREQRKRKHGSKKRRR